MLYSCVGAALGIAVGGSGGLMAAIDTGDLWRYFGAAVFLTITITLYVWHFHLKKAR